MTPLGLPPRETSTGWMLLGAAAVVFAGISGAVVILDIDVLDVRFAFGADEGAEVLAGLGGAGRRHYGYFLIGDVVFLVLYGTALAILLFAVFGRGRPAALLALVPVITAACDLVEDVCVGVALLAHPDPSTGALAAAGAAGVVKHVGFGLSFALLLLGLVIRLPRIRRRGVR